jgi:protein tyrosine/serine phosphatase
MRQFVCSILVFAFYFVGSSAVAGTFTVTTRDLPNFHEVIAHQLYRGGQPTAAGLRALAAMGIKTVVDLRNEYPQYAQQGKFLRVSVCAKCSHQ